MKPTVQSLYCHQKICSFNFFIYLFFQNLMQLLSMIRNLTVQLSSPDFGSLVILLFYNVIYILYHFNKIPTNIMGSSTVCSVPIFVHEYEPCTKFVQSSHLLKIWTSFIQTLIEASQIIYFATNILAYWHGIPDS